MRKIIFSLFLLSVQLISFKTFCQEKKDTIFFDENWSICEQPIAEYYRVCTLNKDKEIYYKGPVTDYYINGDVEMTGTYSNDGYKNGEFIFYANNGLVLKKGKFENDEMKGDWYFYNELGSLRMQFICQSSTDFTPVLLINNNDDTLVKNGTGKFSFSVQKDLPGIFPLSENYYVKGEVVDGLKNGEFDYYYYSNDTNSTRNFFEIYKNGKFVKGKSYDKVVNKPLKFLHLSLGGLSNIDRFSHSDLVFIFNGNSDQKISNFLVNGIVPQLEFSGKNFYDNDKIFFWILSEVLQRDLPNRQYLSSYYLMPDSIDIYSSDSSSDYNHLRNIRGDIALTIDTFGRVVNSRFSTTLTSYEINKINYYLSRITGLIPNENDGEKQMVNVNIKLLTVIDTLGEGEFSAMYMMYNADSVNSNTLNDVVEMNRPVQHQAEFPGGPDAWFKFLDKNLNAQVPVAYNAPPGSYTVTLSFIIDETGQVSNIQVVNDPGYSAAEEALRVLKKSPAWIPAIRNGKKVKYRQKQNIIFNISRYTRQY